MRIFLDPVGGIAGDMFAAALLDAWPDLAEGVGTIIPALGAPDGVAIHIEPHRDAAMSGTRLRVLAPGRGHERYADVRALLQGSRLKDPVKARALAIFALLAEAESRVHGGAVDEVTFHEVGNWDSIVDVTCAAFLIEALGDAAWSVGSLPLGSGRVDTAHGRLPAPAPATVLLLEGFAVHDDGVPGERVTPTGAAILRHLGPGLASTLPTMRLARSGVAFGQRTLDGLSNVLRALAFEPATEAHRADDVAVIQFEVDDQTPEDLAVGLGRILATKGVLDVLQSAVTGKKGRMGAHVQVLAGPQAMDGVIDACFAETTTIGLRWYLAHRSVLRRAVEHVAGGDGEMPVKVASRPGGGQTAKAEMDRVMAAGGGRVARAERRAAAEAEALGRSGRHE